jgi:hypothetical protein
MYLADRVAFHVVVTICSLFNVVPLEGKKIPDPATVEWEDIAVSYVNSIWDMNILILTLTVGTQSALSVGSQCETKRLAIC